MPAMLSMGCEGMQRFVLTAWQPSVSAGLVKRPCMLQPQLMVCPSVTAPHVCCYVMIVCAAASSPFIACVSVLMNSEHLANKHTPISA